MKTNLEFGPELLRNEDKFEDAFFKRFRLRNAPHPLQLTDSISKNYRFPTLYSDVTCAIGIFHCDYERAKNIMPHANILPVKMTKGRSLVIFSCYEYKNVMNVPPYNEIAMTIPVMASPSVNVPVLPMIMSGAFRSFGYYVFGMPVTSKENEIRGRKIWGLPKVTQEIDITECDGHCVTVAKDDSGNPYFELQVPMSGKLTHFDVSGNLYSLLNGEILRSETNFIGDFQVVKHMGQLFKKGDKSDRKYLKISNSPASKTLQSLDIEEHPFQFRYTRSMKSAFDLAKTGLQHCDR